MILDNYTGSKAIQGLFQKMINQIPAHARYAELFAGSAAIYSLLTVRPGEAHLNDLNPEVQTALKIKFPEAEVTSVCTISFLRLMKLVWRRETFVFLDPPYHHSTRPDNTALYVHEMSHDDHVQFLSAALDMECNVMIIHPVCELYETMLKDWRKVYVKVRYHRKTSIECMYMNYDQPTALQSYAHLGTDSWDRQRIKRKGDRFIKKLSALPVLERKYILERLKEFNN